jgi:hypothetical protein
MKGFPSASGCGSTAPQQPELPGNEHLRQIQLPECPEKSGINGGSAGVSLAVA